MLMEMKPSEKTVYDVCMQRPLPTLLASEARNDFDIYGMTVDSCLPMVLRCNLTVVMLACI